MQNNFSSADSHELNFAKAYQWTQPDQDFDIAMKILTCPNIGSECEDDPCAQAETESDKIRCALACHPATPPTVLAHLVHCDIPFILVRIAENPHTDTETLTRLAEDGRAQVRAAVAENTDAPLEVLRKLACDECTDVRFALAENANVPADILQHLTGDDNPYVAYRAQTTIARVQASTLRVETRRINVPFQSHHDAKRKRAGS